MILDDMTRDELIDLKARIDIQLEKLEAQRKAEALDAARKAAEEYGFSLEELSGGKRPAKASSSKVFRNTLTLTTRRNLDRQSRKPKC